MHNHGLFIQKTEFLQSTLKSQLHATFSHFRSDETTLCIELFFALVFIV
jgi:hypothetical protein